MSVDLLRAIESAAVRGWPALEQNEIDGWVWRHTSGGSIRANSVAALVWRGHDIERSIASCEAMYRAKGAPCVFTVSDVSAPRDLDAHLKARGYERGGEHVTMAKVVPSKTSSHIHVSSATNPSEAWLATYLSGLSEDRQGIARRLIANLPRKAQFVSRSPARMPDTTVSSTGLTIIDGPLASVQCMATRPEDRRKGGAWQVLAAIETLARTGGATHLYLQTGGDNLGAQALYSKFGFSIVGRYYTRTMRIG
jgi:N-acetylglutamate synthase